MGREGGAQETELAPATGTGPWLTKVRKTIDGTFNLSCDLMEPFRPIVDRIVFDNVEGDFTKDDKFLLVDMLNQAIPYRGGA